MFTFWNYHVWQYFWDYIVWSLIYLNLSALNGLSHYTVIKLIMYILVLWRWYILVNISYMFLTLTCLFQKLCCMLENDFCSVMEYFCPQWNLPADEWFIKKLASVASGHKLLFTDAVYYYRKRIVSSKNYIRFVLIDFYLQCRYKFWNITG